MLYCYFFIIIIWESFAAAPARACCCRTSCSGSSYAAVRKISTRSRHTSSTNHRCSGKFHIRDSVRSLWEIRLVACGARCSGKFHIQDSVRTAFAGQPRAPCGQSLTLVPLQQTFELSRKLHNCALVDFGWILVDLGVDLGGSCCGSWWILGGSFVEVTIWAQAPPARVEHIASKSAARGAASSAISGHPLLQLEKSRFTSEPNEKHQKLRPPGSIDIHGSSHCC